MKWLKRYAYVERLCRSREGAWIEITLIQKLTARLVVAPARERGLKCQFQIMVNQQSSRSREGAWIEIIKDRTANVSLWVAPARERGLK